MYNCKYEHILYIKIIKIMLHIDKKCDKIIDEVMI